MARALGAVVVLGLGAGCSSPNTYACQSQAQCGADGTCEPSGYCSFPDGECASNARYGQWAPPELAGTCVEPDGVANGSSGEPPDDDSDGSTTGPPPETSETGIDDPIPVTTGPPPDPTTGGIPACGDGVVDVDELCDDGNTIDGDGCNVDCTESGTLLWSSAVDSGAADHLEGLARTDAGFVVSGSQTALDTGQDGIVVGLSADGTEQWTTVLDGGAGADDRLRRLAVDPSGNVYASGWTVQADEDRDVWVVALDPAGTLLWEHVWTSPGSDGGVDIAVGAEGVYVGGCVRSREAAFLRRYAFDGAVDWTEELPNAGTDACIHGLLPTTDGVVAGGWTSTVDTGSDTWVARFDASGTVVWSDQHPSPGESDRIHEVVAVGDGDILAVGRLAAGEDLDMWLRRYTPDGDVVSTWEYDSEGEVSPHDAVETWDGGVVVIGWERELPDSAQFAFIHKLDPEGTSLWRRTVVADARGEAWLGRGLALADGSTLTVGYVDQATRDGLVAVFSR